jgi:hypothetical protein
LKEDSPFVFGVLAMTEQSPVEAIFFAALEKATAEERAAYLGAACGADSNLRQRVERLLAAHPQIGSFLEQPAQGQGGRAETPTDPPAEKGPTSPGLTETTFYRSPGEGVGGVIAGRYKLLEQIGEGGMGAVWVAEQTQPVRRKVALKLIKAGMDSKNVLSRFEAERQALALMDHPNIAKVLDGGTTENGRPFFVMEYVKGIPFTRYCDDARLSIAERLTLFVPVCQAVQHAHQKGIIHRDLKPSNILICLYDGKPVSKVIDFGLAKAMHQSLTKHTLYTGHGVMMGTPLNMSPEQAELNNLDVDTRTDIYALGVILYELLTGTTPLEKQRFKEAAWHEMLRLIKEEDPPRPSARLSGSGSLPTVAAQRQLEPVKLTKLVRGELDWIVMKCLEKDRSRRYETANGLARDVERYLADELVEARPATAGYRLRKLARKHRVAISTAAAFAGLLIAAAAVSSWLAVKATRAESTADDKRFEAEANAKEAEANADLYMNSVFTIAGAVAEAKINALSLQTDLDLVEVRSSSHVGLLRLAHSLKSESARSTIQMPFGPNGPITNTVDLNSMPKYRELREFVTMAVLATGQRFAPLSHPYTHDGFLIRSSFLSPKGERLLTLGADDTARLWDPFTGRQLALLRRAEEKVIEVGLSPDGATAFTHSLDGVIRLWESGDGAFRAEIRPRTGMEKPVNSKVSAAAESGFSPWSTMQLSNDRVLTQEDMWEKKDPKAKSRPVELWDAKTGRFIAELGQPDHELSYGFIGEGRWLEVHNRFGRGRTVRVFSAENGRLLAELKHDEKYGSSRRVPILSPSGQTAATVSETGEMPIEIKYYIHFWDTSSWQLRSTTGPIKWSGFEDLIFQLVADDLFAMNVLMGNTWILRSPIATSIAELPGLINRSLANSILLNSGQLFDTRTWRRLQPPKGRKYHHEITRFAPDGRFVPFTGIDLLDTTTEKAFFMEYGPSFYQAGLGWVGGWVGSLDGSAVTLHRLPPPDRLNIPPDLLELWAQVAVRGQLDDDGAFVKWNEPTWEKKRQELAANPAPYPDFPFPGHVANDRLHWLRQEYTNASDSDKPRLAKQLLDRAEAAGDRGEAVRWRAILTPKPSPTKPASKP